jgi:two-component system, OmpR family, response regulator
MMNKHHILIIDDDKEITQLVRDYLQQNSYRVTTAHDGLRIQRLFAENNFDLAILDVMLPGIDGLTLCQMIRKTSNLPIIMLSAATTEADRVAGLELGADDYIAKPFGARELLARIKAQIRRVSGQLSNDARRLNPLCKLKFEKWQLDRESHCLIGNDEVAILLSHREYELLLIFLENPKRILSRTQLMDLLYDKECEPFDRAIDVLIGRLRKKIENDPKKPLLLKTIRGGGYQFCASVESVECN